MYNPFQVGQRYGVPASRYWRRIVRIDDRMVYFNTSTNSCLQSWERSRWVNWLNTPDIMGDIRQPMGELYLSPT